MERHLIINGVEISGTIGYDNLCMALQATIEGFDPTFGEMRVQFATDILRFVSRTQPSGAAYEAMGFTCFQTMSCVHFCRIQEWHHPYSN